MQARELLRAANTIRSRRNGSAGRQRVAKPLRAPDRAGRSEKSDEKPFVGLQGAVRVELFALAVEAVETHDTASEVFRIGAGIRARRATSCLVTPQVEDVVLVAVREGETPLITAVLTRAANGAATVSVPDAAALYVTAPEIAVTAQRSIAASARTVELEAEEGRLRITKTHFLGETALLVCNTMETLCTNLQSYAHRLIVKAAYALRLIDELDSTVASTVLVEAKQTYSLQAMQTLISSTHDTRLDGERISMG